MVQPPWVRAWRPRLPGVDEVFHARFTDHVYPLHTHDTWTLLILDEGMVRYDLDRHERGALDRTVTLLPPHVPHNGRPAGPRGFRKRVLYLASSQLDDRLIGLAVDRPVVADARLRHQVDALHRALERTGDELEAECLLAFVRERLRDHLERRPGPRPPARDPGIAHRLRDLLDARVVEGVSLQEAARTLHAHPTHLVRAFSRRFGMGPHRYLIGRRVALARTLLLDGVPPRLAATSAGFCDQSHLSRHFKRLLGVGPGQYARSGPRPPAS
ncbi:AraC family transcriptional regulator [Streptomyces sp. URMC 129]|uniref:AraC family transcriptional regulator n=1 Tax=Streptomyces sp. URMC 129 TaxID=3423407 RepID=UPI003F1C2769